MTTLRTHQDKSTDAASKESRSRSGQVPSVSTGHGLLGLQRAAGNRAVSRLIQAKLKVSQPGDPYEREADRVADQVMRMPQPKPGGGEAAASTPARGETTPAQVANAVPSAGGRPLSDETRAFFEPRFDRDFSNVRIHTDDRAADTTRAVNARAFTTGQDIFFRQGGYAPWSSSGRELIAHELTHVVQQNGGIRRWLALGQPGDSYEREADDVARAVIQRERQARQQEAAKRSVRRQEEEEEPIQTKLDASKIQRQIEEEEEEEGIFRAKELPGRTTEVLPDSLPDLQAVEATPAASGRAFHVGRDIVFRAGHYGPEARGHELVHTTWQGRFRAPGKLASDSRCIVNQTSPLQVSRQGLLTAADEAAAIAYNTGRYDERSIRIIQIITGTNVDGKFGGLTANAVAAFQHGLALPADGRVGENTLNVMVPARAAAGRHEHAIQLVVDFYGLDVTSGTLTVRHDPALAVAAATAFESGNLRVIRVGVPTFVSAVALRAAIAAQLAAAAPAVAPPGARPALLTRPQELAAIGFNQSRFSDQRSVRAIQGHVGANPDGRWGPDTVQRVAQAQHAAGAGIDGRVGRATLALFTGQLIAGGNQNAAIRMIVDFFNFRDDGNLLDVHFDPGVAANATTDFRPNEPVRVRVGPAGVAQAFAGLVHTIAHEYEHVRRLKQGIVMAATHEFLGEAIEILSVGMPQEPLETLAPGAVGYVPGFANDAQRALVNWNAMPLADRTTFRARFIAARNRVRARIAAGTPAQQALHAALLAGYNAVVVPPP